MKARTAPASSEEANVPIMPEVRLFRHIILVAVLDAIHGSHDRKTTDRTKLAAINWFKDAGDDFKLICECAGLDPAMVRREALSYMQIERQKPAGARPHIHQSHPKLKKAA